MYFKNGLIPQLRIFYSDAYNHAVNPYLMTMRLMHGLGTSVRQIAMTAAEYDATPPAAMPHGILHVGPHLVYINDPLGSGAGAVPLKPCDVAAHLVVGPTGGGPPMDPMTDINMPVDTQGLLFRYYQGEPELLATVVAALTDWLTKYAHHPPAELLFRASQQRWTPVDVGALKGAYTFDGCIVDGLDHPVIGPLIGSRECIVQCGSIIVTDVLRSAIKMAIGYYVYGGGGDAVRRELRRIGGQAAPPPPRHAYLWPPPTAAVHVSNGAPVQRTFGASAADGRQHDCYDCSCGAQAVGLFTVERVVHEPAAARVPYRLCESSFRPDCVRQQQSEKGVPCVVRHAAALLAAWHAAVHAAEQ